MSSEVYELLKRADEFFVVNKAHRNPRFVEDVVSAARLFPSDDPLQPVNVVCYDAGDCSAGISTPPVPSP